MVGRMIRRGLIVAPLVVLGLWLWGGSEAALSGALGVGVALLNLWLTARVIGGVADTSPQLLLVAALVAFGLSLGLVAGIASAMRSIDAVSFPVAGLTLIATHLGLVLWEAARAFPVGGTDRTSMMKAGSRTWNST
jgi:hypothetical protein